MDIGTIINNIIDIMKKYWRVFLLEGIPTTLELTAIAVLLGALLGAVVTMLKRSRFRIVRFLVSVYVEVIRGTPILLQLTIFYFVVPELLPFLDLSAFMWVAIALCINSSAYVSEVFRSGIQAVDSGQAEASRSLGMSKSQTMLRIILPQAIRNILPALGNEFIMITKDTSLASTFFIGDLMTQCLLIKGATYLTIEPLLIIGIIYFIVTFVLSKVVSAYERRLRRGDIR